MFASLLLHLFFAAIPLTGVVGDNLRTRAFFDANNVKVGDPLVLTIDFIGAADFSALHPPALSKSLSRTDWKLDDASAKTDTYEDARRLTYRVRPMREGVLYFPALTFTYLDATNAPRTITSNPIPVHAKRSHDIVVAGMAQQDELALPEPPPLITALETDDPDLDFAWRKACAAPTADAFAAFDFPAAKLNEARCATLAGDWHRALKIYSRLEWRIGQTPEIERGLIAALAVRFSNPLVELPVWRQVARPILRYAALGRIVILSAALFILAFLYFILRCALRALAVLALVCTLSLTAQAQSFDPFKEMDEMMKRHDQIFQQMQQQAFGGNGLTLNFDDDEQMPFTNLVATVQPSNPTPQVGENFDLIFSLELPRNVGIAGGVKLEMPDNIPFMRHATRTDEMTNGTAANPSNILKRLSLSVRFDAPFKDELKFALNIPLQYRIERKFKNTSFVSTQVRTVRVVVPSLALDVKPLPSANQPSDFSGIIASRLQLTTSLDLSDVETNDVISIYYHLKTDGYIPPTWTPPDISYEDRRSSDSQAIIWRRYFVASGDTTTPSFEVCWYDPKEKVYRRQTIPGKTISYHATP